MFPFFSLLFVGLTMVCLVPFVIALAYMVLGIKTYLMGRREKSKTTAISGINAIVLSLLGMMLSFALWCWLCRGLLSWEL